MRHLLLAFTLFPIALSAQSILIEFNAGSSVSYPIIDVRSTDLESSTMRVHLWNGSTEVYERTAIARCEFLGSTAAISESGGSPLSAEVFPNPSSGSVRITCAVTAGTPVRAEILDMSGKLVRTLYTGPASGPSLVLNWSGADDEGAAAADGTYLCRISQGAVMATSQVIIQR